MQPLDLLDTAADLLKGNAKPREANLRRAQSTIYYAMFHCLCKQSADALVGGKGAVRSNKAWKQTYRALNHGKTRQSCSHNQIAKFPDHIRDFANLFVSLQEKRHEADYDPHARFVKSGVNNDLIWARQAIVNFTRSPINDRRAFCAFVLFAARV